MKPIMKSLIICMAFFITNNTLEANDSNRHIGMKWELGYAATKEAKPEKWIPATVPGAVQLDIAKAEKYAPYYYAEHWKDYQWMEDNYYTYRSNFKKPELLATEKLYFISKLSLIHISEPTRLGMIS